MLLSIFFPSTIPTKPPNPRRIHNFYTNDGVMAAELLHYKVFIGEGMEADSKASRECNARIS